MRASVVIPTYNRAAKLARLLACLQDQPARALAEVLVCDDGSPDETAAVARSFAGRLPLVYLHQPDLGFRAGQARNLGLSRATGEVIVFVDDDLVVPQGFLEAHVAAHAASPAGRPSVALGFRHRTFEHVVGTPRWQDVVAGEPDDRAGALGPEGDRLGADPAPWFYGYSCNLSACRLPPGFHFDDAFVGWGMEDLDFSYRLMRMGAYFTVAARGRALHLEDPAPRDPFRCEVRELPPSYDSYVRNAVYFLDKHRGDATLEHLIRKDLRWYLRDPASGRWIKNGYENDVEAVLAECRRERQLHPRALEHHVEGE